MTITIANLSFSPVVLILSIVVIVNLALAWRVWRGNPRHPVNIYFALTVLMVACWTMALLVGEYVAMSPYIISLFIRFSYFGAALLIFLFYLFTYYFPYKVRQVAGGHIFYLVAGTAFILIICLLPDVFIAGYVLPEDRFKPEVSLFWHLVFALYFFSIAFFSFRNLILKYKRSDGIWRIRLKQVIIATAVAVVGGSIFSLFIPIMHNQELDWLGPLFTFFMATYIWYHIFRKQD